MLKIGILVFTGLEVGALPKSELTMTLQEASTDEYDMVIISPSMFSTVLQPLINHKNSHNVHTIFKNNRRNL